MGGYPTKLGAAYPKFITPTAMQQQIFPTPSITHGEYLRDMRPIRYCRSRVTVPATTYVQGPSLVLRDGSLFSECAHSWNIRFESLLLGTISLGCKLN